MKQKWKDNRGETLVEVLASILIGALSVALLFSAVMASYRMDKQAEAVDKAFSENLAAAEAQTTEASVTNSDVTVENKDDGSQESVIVKFYGGEGAWSFKLPGP